ncbi:MAG: RNA methyltransferase [Eubacteriales bacterium]|nr:RNA methyltransferase [Eubacteriales bacterium]
MITSAYNAQVKRIIQLNAKAKTRREEGCFVVEGIKLFRETPEELRRQVFVSESFIKNHADVIGGIHAEIVEDRLFAKMCDTQTPQGILTVAAFPTYEREELLGGKNGVAPLILVLEDLQDPGNVGTILRTAEGAGVTGVFLSSRTADVFQPKVTRSTMGSIFRVPFRREENLAEVMDWMKQQGIRSYAAHLKGQNSYAREAYTGGTAFLIGNEGNGLSDELAGKADTYIRIPMEGKVESLNAGIAAALLMYTAHSQRH